MVHNLHPSFHTVHYSTLCTLPPNVWIFWRVVLSPNFVFIIYKYKTTSVSRFKSPWQMMSGVHTVKPLALADAMNIYNIERPNKVGNVKDMQDIWSTVKSSPILNMFSHPVSAPGSPAPLLLYKQICKHCRGPTFHTFFSNLDKCIPWALEVRLMLLEIL